MPRRVALLEAAPDSDFSLQPDHTLRWDAVEVARLRPGASLLRPQIEVSDSEFLDGRQRERLRQRLALFVAALVGRDLAPLLRALESGRHDGELRGALHRLEESGGLVPGPTEITIPPPLRARLKRLGVRAGRFALYVPDLLKPRPAALRALLWAVRHGCGTPTLPAPGPVSLKMPSDTDIGPWQMMGWIPAGPVLVRLDIAERVAAELAWATRARPTALSSQLGPSMGLTADALPPVLRALGLRIIPAPALAEDQYGPPSPPLIGSPRKRTPEMEKPQAPKADGPFAALAALRR
jgi:ATP-dependent RNA helicase SUPV3L1/SUV3